MATFRFLHAADIHLDSPLRGLSAYPGAPADRLRSATRDAFAELVGFAIQERVAFLIIAGDLYDGGWRDFNTGIYFTSEASRLAREGIQIILLRGNHDAESQITKSLRLPENVKLFGARRPGTIRLEEFGVALHGQSYARRDVNENLAAAYPEPVAGALNIGVLHTALAGDSKHQPYARCSLDELRARGYDYWALGHVHERRILSEDPYVVFPGNLQGRSIRETGAKGAVLVTCEDLQVTGVEEINFDVVRWTLLRVDAAGAADPDAVLARARSGMERAVEEADRPLAARVEIGGECPAHGALLRNESQFHAEIRAISAEIGAEKLWVEKIQLSTSAPPQADSRDAIGDLQSILDSAPVDGELHEQLRKEFAKMIAKLPAEIRDPERNKDAALEALLDDRIGDLTREVAPSLTARLLAGKD